MWNSLITKGHCACCETLDGAQSIKTALAEPLRGKLLDPFQDTSWVPHWSGHAVMCDQAHKSEIKSQSEMELLSDSGLHLNTRYFVSHPKVLLKNQRLIEVRTNSPQ